MAFDPRATEPTLKSDTIPRIAQRYKARNEPWALVVDENYGEGSAREHAALQPRFYGKEAIRATYAIVNTYFRMCHDYRAIVCKDPRNEPEGKMS